MPRQDAGATALGTCRYSLCCRGLRQQTRATTNKWRGTLAPTSFGRTENDPIILPPPPPVPALLSRQFWRRLRAGLWVGGGGGGPPGTSRLGTRPPGSRFRVLFGVAIHCRKLRLRTPVDFRFLAGSFAYELQWTFDSWPVASLTNSRGLSILGRSLRLRTPEDFRFLA